MDNPEKMEDLPHEPYSRAYRRSLSGQSGIPTGTLQIVVEESFAPTLGWIVSGGGSGLQRTGQYGIDYAKRSQFTGDEHWIVDMWEHTLATKRRLSVKSELIAMHMDRLMAVRMPLMAPYIPMAIADGGTYYVSIYGGIQAASHFVWRKGSPPKGWEPLQLVIEEMLECFQE